MPTTSARPPAAATTSRVSPSSCTSHMRIAASTPASDLGGVDRRRVDALSVGGGDERHAGFAQRALAQGGALLLADQAGHADDHEQEQEDRAALSTLQCRPALAAECLHQPHAGGSEGRPW